MPQSSLASALAEEEEVVDLQLTIITLHLHPNNSISNSLRLLLLISTTYQDLKRVLFTEPLLLLIVSAGEEWEEEGAMPTAPPALHQY